MHTVNKARGCRGFTFVEMIVAAVIVAVLAAVAIPMYRGYVLGQRQATVDNLAQTAGAAANAYWRRTGIPLTNDAFLPGNSGKLNLYYSTTSYSITVSGNAINVKDLSNTSIYNNKVNYN
jgi:prepilin-type N-terminal cleavage/methylation domain-containing protein